MKSLVILSECSFYVQAVNNISPPIDEKNEGEFFFKFEIYLFYLPTFIELGLY